MIIATRAFPRTDSENMVPTGIPAIDDVWEGFHRGEAYIIYGRAKRGRRLLTLQMARSSVERGEKCVYVTPRRHREVAEQGDVIGFDVAEAVRTGLLRLLRAPGSVAAGTADGVIEQTLLRLGDAITAEDPRLLVVEDFTPFVHLGALGRLEAMSRHFIERIGLAGTVAVLGLGEPGNERAREVITQLRLLTSGAIHADLDRESPESSSRRLTLLPPPRSGASLHEIDIDLAHLTSISSMVATEHAVSAGGDGESDFALRSLVTASTAHPARQQSTRTPIPARTDGAAADDGARGTASPPTPPAAQREPVRYFDVQELYGPSSRPADPFDKDSSTDRLIAGGRYLEGVSSDYEPQNRSRKDAAGVSAQDQVTQADPLLTTRESFETCFDAARRAFLGEGKPFVAIAFRLDPSRAEVANLPPLETLVRLAASANVPLIAAPDRQRVALLLPDGRAADATGLLRRLRQEVQQLQPRLPANAVGAIATIVVPNGDPFNSGCTFLEYAFQST